MRLIAILLFAFTVPTIVVSQGSQAASKDSPSQRLQLTSTARVPLSGSLVGKARCDEDNNIYVRFMDAETAHKHNGISTIPIKKIRPDGTVAATFRVTDAAPEIVGKDFSVTSGGRVYQAAWTPDGTVYVVGYSNDGSFKSKVRLEADFFTPYQIAVFASGEFLLSGTQGRFDRVPFTGVFAPDGHLIKKIYEPEDEGSRQKAELGDPNFRSDYTNAGNTFVWYGDAVAGSDGNVYLLRSISPALLYVISSKGEVLRKLRIESSGAGLVARTMRAGPGKLAISFLERYSTKGITEVVDLQGNLLTNIFSDNETTIYPGHPGCYSSGAFVFISGDANHDMHLYKAEPK